MASDAVSNERVSRTVGYKIKKGDFRLQSPNLPQRIAILGEANELNQSGLSLDPVQITSAKQAGELYGYGSPIYSMLRILKPVNGDGVGGIPIWVYPQAKSGGASEKIMRITPSGSALRNGTHTIKINGRTAVDGSNYDVNIVAGDTVAIITRKIADVINAVIGSPATAINLNYETQIRSKWAGLTANEMNISVDTGSDALGLTYTVGTLQAGIGTPSVSDALNLFQSNWNTIVVNSYGLVTSVLTALESFNGKADPNIPTGRYQGTTMKPFIAIAGSVSDDPSSITDSRLNEMTNAVAPAPGSLGFSFEAAANMAYLFANRMQNNPELDVCGQSYPDMPTPSSIGSMATFENRDAIVKKGCSTVDLVSGAYQVQDFVTTYHPVGENPPQFRYCRNIIGVDMNVFYTINIWQLANILDHVIVDDDADVVVNNSISPKQAVQGMRSCIDDLFTRALVADREFSKSRITVEISGTNPDRLDIALPYKRTGVARIISTDVEAGFNFGTSGN